MKKLLLFIAILCLGLSVNAQNRRYYCELIGMYEGKEYINYNVVISFDDGPFPFRDSFGKIKLNGNTLVNKDGLAYSSAMQAVNYMSQQGWQLLQVYSNSLVGSTHYVMYKDAPSIAKDVENIWIGSGRRDYGQYEEVIPLVEEIRWESEDEIEDEIEE